MRSASAIFMSRTEAITCLLQIVTLRSCEERMGDHRGTKVMPWFKHYSSCGWQKGTSRDKAMLISEEIKSIALVVLKLCLSKAISKSVSQ